MSAPTSEQLLRDENEQLRAHLTELESRLVEPEEIVRAIREGEVDAFVVSEAPGDQIYTLRSADLLYRRMIEDMKEGALALDAKGTILYCNACFAHLVQGDRARMTGASILSFVAPESRESFEGLRKEALGGTGRRELSFARDSGESFPVLATMNWIPFEDDQVLCLIVTDLTMQRQNEALLQENQRKDEFLAMLAHELRNPLAPIRNAVQLLRMGANQPRPGLAIDVIDRQVTQLTRLVDDLLDVSRITRGKIGLELAPVELSDVIERGLEIARPLIERQRHELTVDLPAGSLRVHADPVRMSQVISNLLTNAAKFTPAGGGKIVLAVRCEGAAATITVRDNGIGIAPQMLPQIFDLFTQADAGLGRTQSGLGIGLTLVRSLVKMHGGTVEARSLGLGHGSEFIVSLPLL